MRLTLILSTILCFLQVSELHAQQLSQEEVILTNIVFMRTEGLVMTQLLEQKSKNKKVLAICKRARRYYIQTQPTLLEVLKGKMLALDARQFEDISKEAEKKFDKYSVKNEGQWVRLYQDHIQNAIRTYSLLLQERKWASVTYFSFLALPELINLQEEVKKLKIK
jgi:hypothetical protein